MNFDLSVWGELFIQSRRRESVLVRGIRVLAPLFFVIVGGVFPAAKGNAFSELANLPAVTLIENTQDSLQESSSPSVRVDSEDDTQRTRCRWQMDRVLLSSLGQGTTRESSLIGCTPTKEEVRGDVRVENRGIREKVTALASDAYPLSDMAGSIATYDAHIAGLIVGIAKKESDWGKHTPKLHGEECFNYWGYRGYGNRGVTEDGYGCFEKPADAVNTIGNRLIELSQLRGTTDPERMIVWKCGSSCATHSPASVQKWISDVRLYYQQFAGVSE